MLWVIQNDLYSERGYARFVEAVERLGLEHVFVKVVPFADKLLPVTFNSSLDVDLDDVPEPFIDTSKRIVAFGTITLNRIASARGWTPGIFTNDNFDYDVWSEKFGKENVLNGDSVVGTVADISVPPEWDWVFLRPTLDNKAFTGMVLSKHDFHDWKMRISIIDESDDFTPLHRGTKIAIAPAKKIYAEYRLFFVNGKLITGSLYKRGNDVFHQEGADVEVGWFAKRMVNKWQPADAFVLDVAKTPDGPKVIEINTINSSGFYEANVQRIVQAIEDMS